MITIITQFCLTILIICQLADYWTTRKILNSGGVELNPVVARFFIGTFGQTVGLLLAKLFASIAMLALAHFGLLDSTQGAVALATLTLFYVWVVVHNFIQYRSSK